MHAPRTRAAVGLLVSTVVGSALVLSGLLPAAAAPERRTYVVRDGDTLSEIAARTGSTTEALATTNGIDDPDHILTGRRLTIPPSWPPAASVSSSSAETRASQVHVVQDGDSFWSIAQRNGVSAAALANANGRSPDAVIHAGDRLAIPARTTGVPATLVRTGRIGLQPTFERWAQRNGIDPALLQAVCYLESGWQEHVVSRTGAVGVCQLMPSAVDFAEQLIGKDLDPRDPTDNIRMGARTLRWLLDQTGGDRRQALAAYYQGLAALERSGPYPETVEYVDAVEALSERF